MPRYKITIEYNGAPFVGWQIQENGSSVQGAVTRALFDLSGERITVYGAGRTDTGVHGLGQVAHFDLTKDWRVDKLRDGLNFHLKPDPIAVLTAQKVDGGFDARFSAVRRYYRYRIINRRSPLTLERGLAWRVARDLDANSMHDSAQIMCGSHDFTTFRSINCQAKSPVKTIDTISVSRYGEEIEIAVAARSFLHNQVRSIVGSLKFVGEGKWRAHDLKQALGARDRAACGPVAPPEGLYLLQVDYQPDPEGNSK